MAINIGVDVGGTFTDFAVSGSAAGTLYYKLPSTPEKPDQRKRGHTDPYKEQTA